jgi:hypothetical protein
LTYLEVSIAVEREGKGIARSSGGHSCVSTASWRRAVAPRHCHAAGAHSGRLHGRCRQPPTTRLPVCPCRRALPAVGVMVAIELLTVRHSPSRPGWTDSRLTRHERNTPSTPSNRRAQVRTRNVCLRFLGADADVSPIAPHSVRCSVWTLASNHRTPGATTPQRARTASVRFNAHTDPPRPPQTSAASFKQLYRE